jgi:hypothetical protein
MAQSAQSVGRSLLARHEQDFDACVARCAAICAPMTPAPIPHCWYRHHEQGNLTYQGMGGCSAA